MPRGMVVLSIKPTFLTAELAHMFETTTFEIWHVAHLVLTFEMLE
jgi:hypothetical protein